MANALPLFFLMISVITQGMAEFVVEKNNLRVTSPASIRGTYDSAMANVGIPQHGGTLMGIVIYPGSLTYPENSKACRPFHISFSSHFHKRDLPPVLLVDRGDCSFALKVWNAQNAGAAAVLISDYSEEALIMTPEEADDSSAADYLRKITIPSALIQRTLGDKLKNAFNDAYNVDINLDWRDYVPHSHAPVLVEYALWANSNDQCGEKCEIQMQFLKNLKQAAQILEKGGYAHFTPHYLTWSWPDPVPSRSMQCKSQCINNGRYCAPDPEWDTSRGYDGKDVVIENLRQLCVFRAAQENQRPWAWWDYVTHFHERCPMKENKFNKECADGVIKSLGLDSTKIEKCMGDPNADAENPVLKEEQDAQVGHGGRNDVAILPTLMINNREYRGKLDTGFVLKAICAGFEGTTEPSICVNKGKMPKEAKVGWVVPGLVLLFLVFVALGGYAFYTYTCRSYMDSKIKAIMSQYMPLESTEDDPIYIPSEV